MTRRAFSVAAACAASLGLSVLAAPSAWALPVDAPVAGGCPAGYQLLSVEGLIALDKDYAPLRGVDADRDGLVCGRSLPAAAGERICADCGVPVVYLFRDDTLAAAR